MFDHKFSSYTVLALAAVILILIMIMFKLTSLRQASKDNSAITFTLKTTDEENSEDRNSQNYLYDFKDNELTYKFTYKGYHPDTNLERDSEKKINLSDEDAERLAIMISRIDPDEPGLPLSTVERAGTTTKSGELVLIKPRQYSFTFNGVEAELSKSNNYTVSTEIAAFLQELVNNAD